MSGGKTRMAVGFYDYDLELKPHKLMLNLEAMKIASYYHNLGESISLVNNLTCADNYDQFYICRNVLYKQSDAVVKNEVEVANKPHVHRIGLAYSNGIYIPMEEKFEIQTPYIQLYATYLRDKVLAKEITFPQVEKILNSHFIRLRAGAYQMDLTKLKRKEKIWIYDYEIEKVDDWYNKLRYCRENLMKGIKTSRVIVVNGFKFTSFDNVKKLSEIPGFGSDDVHLFSSDTYGEFVERFNSIAPWVSSRDGIKYYYGHDINPTSDNEVARNLCLSINKYCYAKSILKACEFIVDDKCEVSPLNKLQKDFQYWTLVRLGDQTLKDYYLQRNRRNFDDYYKIIASTPYKRQFDSLCNKTKNEIKKVGWYYHV